MFKVCNKCGEYKEHKVRKDRGGAPQHHCVDCQSAYRKQHYEENKQKYVEKASNLRKKRTREIQKLKEVPCADCGVQYPYYVMQFDHVNGKKEFGISVGAGAVSKDRMAAELAKTEVVCANCHAERTFHRMNK